MLSVVVLLTCAVFAIATGGSLICPPFAIIFAGASFLLLKQALIREDGEHFVLYFPTLAAIVSFLLLSAQRRWTVVVGAVTLLLCLTGRFVLIGTPFTPSDARNLLLESDPGW